MDDLTKLKRNIRETNYPYFTDEELTDLLEECGSVDLASYRALVTKSEDSSIQVTGFSASDSSKYFLRLASQFRPRNSGTLQGG
jgi:hypothetical protein